jgi:hypothetical protein
LLLAITIKNALNCMNKGRMYQLFFETSCSPPLEPRLLKLISPPTQVVKRPEGYPESITMKREMKINRFAT